jgi:dTDP-4-dehydrorhamnose 3,5-epimerase
VAVDIRNGSPTFGQWYGETLTASDGKQIWIPPGFAHGFCTIEPDTVICYKVTDYYDSECDSGLAWDDPLIGITWPAIADPETLSRKDFTQRAFTESLSYFSWSP